MKKFVIHTGLWTALVAWCCLIVFLTTAAFPGAVFDEDVWVGWFWLSGLAAILTTGAGIAAFTSQID
jgi:hypothetical protein